VAAPLQPSLPVPGALAGRVSFLTLRLCGLLSLAGIVGGSLLVVLAAAERHSFLSPTSRHGFPGWMSGPLAGLLPGLTHDTHALRVDFTAAVASMYLLYVIVVLSARALTTQSVLIAIGAVHVIFFLSPPLPLTDIFNYIDYAHMGALHGLNPYVHVPVSNHADPVYHLTTWHHLRSPYGPLFTLGTYALAPLPLPVAYWAFKGAVACASLGCLALVWKCARVLGRSPRAAVAFVGLNPLFIVYGLGGQHNDVFMMLFVLAGVYLVLRRHEALGGGALAAAVAVKASAGLLLPIVLLGARSRVRAVAGAVLGGVLALELTLAVFGPHLPNIGVQSNLVAPFGLVNYVGIALGGGGATASLRRALEAILILGVLIACVFAARSGTETAQRRDWLVAAGAASLLLVLTLSWAMPWYVLWVLPFAALVRTAALRAAVLVLGVTLLFTWLPLGQDFGHDVLDHNPTRTSVGKENTAYSHRFLR
jgi:hypothetical protein